MLPELEVLLLEDEELLVELEELELLDELPQTSTTPPSSVWLIQVSIPMQLRLFSQPQPLFRFSHRGRGSS